MVQNPKRIALICQHFYPEMTSSGLLYTQLCVELVKRGWHVRVYCTQPIYDDVSRQNQAAEQSRMVYEGVEVVRVPALGGHASGLLMRGLNALSYLFFAAFYLIRDRKTLSGMVNTTNPPFLGLALLFVKLVTRLRYITLVHDVYPDIAVAIGVLQPKSFITRVWERMSALIFNHSESLIVIGEDMAELVRAKLKSPATKPLVLIPNWSNPALIYPVPRAKNPFVREQKMEDVFTIQYSGRMGRTHNIEPLIEAARLLQDQPIRIQLIGQGAKRASLEALAVSYGLKNVQFLPYQPFEELMNVLSAPHLSVVCLASACTGASVPSKSYGMMAASRPILAFLDKESEIGRTVADNQCGIVLPAPTGEQVAEVIRHLVADPARFEQMGLRGYAAFLQTYTLAHAVHAYDTVLSDHFEKS